MKDSARHSPRSDSSPVAAEHRRRNHVRIHGVVVRRFLAALCCSPAATGLCRHSVLASRGSGGDFFFLGGAGPRSHMTCRKFQPLARIRPLPKRPGRRAPCAGAPVHLWLCRIFQERYKASSSCHSPGDTVCASMCVHARACACCRAFHCLPRLSFVADGLTVHPPHLPSEADVAGSVMQSSRTSSLKAAHEGPRRRDRASRLRATRLPDHLPTLSTAPTGLRRLSYSEEKGTGFFRVFQERKARRQAPVRVCQQILVLYASFPSRERFCELREDRSLPSGFLSRAICAKGHDPPRAGGSACRAHPPPGQGGSLPHGAPRTCESAPLISFVRVSALHATTPGPLCCCNPRSMILVHVAGREI